MAGEAIRRLPTLADQQALRRATPKRPAPLAKLDRAKAKVKVDREDLKKLAAWSKAVKHRDKWTCRFTGKPVKKPTLVGILHPDAAHAHHVEPRANIDTRHDRRNGLTVSYETHLKLEANELKVVGSKYFTVKGKRYLNCDDPSTKVVPA